MDDHLLSNLIPEFNDPPETFPDPLYPPRLKEAFEEAARQRGEDIERDESQTQSLERIVKMLQESSTKDEKRDGFQWSVFLVNTIIAVIILAVSVATLVVTIMK